MIRSLPATAFVAVAFFTGSAMAQPDLAITMAETGNFSYPNCTQYSPQFTYVTSVPGGCRSTITLWVANIGSAPTASPVNVENTFLPGQRRAGTILSASGTGWTCNSNVLCTRPDPLAPGASYPPIVINVLVEDFATPPLNNLATVSTAGDTNPANDSAFDSNVVWPPNMGATDIAGVPILTGRLSQLVIHTVPEGLFVYANGQVVKTPHTYITPIDMGNPPTSPQMMFSISATDYNGNPIPANAPWAPTGIVTSGGTTQTPPFRAGSNSVDYFLTGTWYEHVTVLFSHP
jgi:hypothetical protein